MCIKPLQKPGRFPTKVWNSSNASFEMFGDGCYNGWAVVETSPWKFAYYPSMSAIEDLTDGLTDLNFQPDVIFLGTNHHDQNNNVSNFRVLSELFRTRNTRFIRQFPGAKVVAVSSWASNLVNRRLYWWAGLFDRQVQMLEALRADSRVHTLSLLQYTFPLIHKFEPDGIHFTMQFPLSNIACLLEHVVHALIASGSK